MTHLLNCLLFVWRLGSPTSIVPVLALGTLVMLSCQLAIPIWDVDIFWQLKFGEMTLQSGLPSHEPLLAYKQHEPLAAFYWLGQVLYTLVFQLGGWPLLRLVDAVVWLGGFFVVARHCGRRLGNDWPALAALATGWFAALPFASLRMQSLGVLCFGLMISLVRSQQPSRIKFFVCCGLLLVWQNLHPSVIIAVIYLGCRMVVEWWQYWRRESDTRPITTTLLTCFAAVATVMTPLGFRIFALSAYNGTISKEQRGITEWQPLWAYNGLDYGREAVWIAFAMTFVVVVVGLVFCRRNVKLVDLLPLIAFTAMTLYCHRFVLFWGVVVIPVIAECISALLERWTLRALPAPRTRIRHLIQQLLLLLAAVFAIAVPLYQQLAPFAEYFPFQAVQALKARQFKGVIYNDYFWGGVLSFEGHPDWMPTHDGRYYIFTRDEWDRYDEAAAGKVPLAEIEQQFRPEVFFLRKGSYDGLITLVRQSSLWTVLFEDSLSIVFLRR